MGLNPSNLFRKEERDHSDKLLNDEYLADPTDSDYKIFIILNIKLVS